ncbi:adaptin ear-binding coat-associated protein 1 [Limosa lapponica baueri]|uniref:Adaptin ear-binding coat-associated protein 1 n=1 Tax=Limosa lapponica baueri TaxID=1758121 RepID=A0A2I0TS94_LIMLA|nr:adaptin ear-binding coat-associated protein 1 [Limosa lapponica baueri]
MKKDFKALGQLVKGSGAQVVFSSAPPVMGTNEWTNKKIRQINTWLHNWCYHQGFGYSDHSLIYRTPGLLENDGKTLSQKGKSVWPRVSKDFAQGFKLEVKGEGDKTRPNGNEPGGKGPKMGVKLGAQLKGIYTNAHSMGNKQEELEAIVQQENYDIVAITETWWDDLHNWSTAINGYQLFRRDRQGRRGGGVALYVRDRFECLEVNNGNDSVECLWIRLKGKANKADIMVGVYYRPQKQDTEVDETFYQQLEKLLQSLPLVLVGDFNFPDICWKYNTAEKEQSRRFLECVEDNFLTQLVSEPTRESTLMDLLLVNREGLMGDVKVQGRLGQSDHDIIELSILAEARQGASRTATLDF